MSEVNTLSAAATAGEETGLTSAQREAITGRSDLVVEAGAGAGKTLVLVERYLRLLTEERLQVSEILAITFTNKAAAEMRSRLEKEAQRRLAAAAEAETRAYWEGVAAELPMAPISTFHSFCARLLRENPTAVPVDPAFRILDENEATLLGERAAEQALVELIAELEPQTEAGQALSSLLEENEKGLLRKTLVKVAEGIVGRGEDVATALAAAEAALTPAAARLAGAREDVWSAVAEILSLEEGLTEKMREQQAALRRVWREAEPRLAALCGGQVSVDGETFREAGRLLKEICGTVQARGKGFKEPVSALREAATALQEALLDLTALPRVRLLGRLLSRYLELVAAEKSRAGLLTYNDLEVGARNLLRDHPRLAAYYGARYRQILVDEFQDTNRLQKEILDLLRAASAEAGERPLLFVVGDPKQSIYRFRGAEVEVFGATATELTAGGGKRVHLAHNFRTLGPLIRWVNYVFPRLLEGTTIAYEAMEAVREPAVPGEPCLELLLTERPEEAGEDGEGEEETGLSQARAATLGAGDSGVTRWEQEARFLAMRIRQLVEGGERRVYPPQATAPRAVRYGDIAVLFASMTHVRLYEEAFREAGIPYYTLAGSGFYAKQEIQDVLNFLRFLDNVTLEIPLVGILRSPFFGLADSTLFWLTRGGPGLYRRLMEGPLPPELGAVERQKVRFVRETLGRFLELRQRLSLPELIACILQETAYTTSVLAEPDGKQRLANLEKLIAIARDFAAKGLFTLPEFLHYLEDLIVQEAREGEVPLLGEADDTVKLLTIHKAKGLEFPVVILPDLSRRLQSGGRGPQGTFTYAPGVGLALSVRNAEGKALPAGAARRLREEEHSAEREEFKRLFYVATTRARDYLILSGTVPRPGARRDAAGQSWLSWLAGIWEISDWHEVPPFLTFGEERFPVYCTWRTEWAAVMGSPLRRESEDAGAAAARTSGAAPEVAASRAEGARREEVLPEMPSWSVPVARREEAGEGGEPVPEEAGGEVVSVSALLRLAACPRRYFYQYRWRLPEAGEVKSPSGIAGEKRSSGDEEGESAAGSEGIFPEWDEPAEPEAGEDMQGITPGLWAWQRGRIVHRVCEHLTQAEELEPLLAEAIAREAPELASAAYPSLVAALRPLLHHYLASPVFRAYGAASGRRAHELPVTCKLGRYLLEGVIDLVWEEETGIRLVDLKTNRVETGELERLAEEYRLQVETYAYAIWKLWGREPVTASLYFLAADTLKTWTYTAKELSALASDLERYCAFLATRRQREEFPPRRQACPTCPYRELSLCED